MLTLRPASLAAAAASCLAPLVSGWLFAAQIPPASEWARADLATVRLAPAQFTDLPVAIRRELDRRECTVPQPYTARPDKPVNAVSGHFITATATDWAVLCSRQRRSSILVFRSGGVARIDELAEEADTSKLQGIGEGRIGYSRGIGVSSPRYIRDHNPNANPPLPLLDHDGIDDAFIGKASVILYWSGNRWVKLLGADTPTVRSDARTRPAGRDQDGPFLILRR